MADRYFRIKVQHRLRRAERKRGPDPAEAGKTAEEPEQPELDFPDIEEFRGIPKYLPMHGDDGQIVYPNYMDDTNEEMRAAMLKFKDIRITFDTLSRQRLAVANGRASGLVKLFGDLPPRELIRLWRESQAKAVKGGA
jgi:hypothetical protein